MIMDQRWMVSGKELWQWRQDACKSAAEAGVSTAEVDWLLKEVAELDPLVLRLESWQQCALSGKVAENSTIQLSQPLPVLTQLWQRRIHQRCPVQYLAEVAPWRHFSLRVSPAVLIPRPETESLIDLAVNAVAMSSKPDLSSGHWADLGTGSGAIACGLAEVFPHGTIHAVDCTEEALAIAQLNAQQLGMAEKIKFYHGSWYSPLEALKGQFSGIVANPPYIPSNSLKQLQPEIYYHEPHIALDGGRDGLDCIRQLIEISGDYLRPGGVWLIEMMAGQADKVVQLLQNQGSYSQIQIFPDLAGIDRFALAYRKYEV
ncbi:MULTISPECIES: peptide chain release factor N(5)-glutamine methyltransferase [unclassified Moorena]|uniref:peptide chain release factor N(5)-glutamine methyltransferase n=1 Tax=unclassified Moorena TaxID=2683338 RepID=UPI0014016016|nr:MULTISPECIES: peptide chain release factor N(5)-glutamine methyltransferase [unclassified Moorena]NEO16372.1 peptide chain release factor N(5)-glutamine methyltransferase [Moorena sp. SIO3E8]NEQ02921.1 peptide chain release factor N(5)-glutamine methyltransferase [Moorena sp. SIO3F7]